MGSIQKEQQGVIGAIVREYAAIAFQEIGLRTAARRLRAPRRRAASRSAAGIAVSPQPGLRSDCAEGRQPEGNAAGAQPVIIIDTESERLLQFSEGALQSRMRLDDPYALIAPYTRQMMSFLLFDPDPEHILLIGLGGGSLAKFCYRRLPHTRITVVESDARVIALRNAFHIPKDDHRFRIVHDEGAWYLSRCEEPMNAILIDAFDEAGVSPSLATSSFFRDASRLLTSIGVLIMNLHGDPERFAEHVRQARGVFGERTLLANVTANDNLLLYGFAADAPPPANKHLFLRARHLQAKMPLNFRLYLKRLREGRLPENE
jgi:spermidine synthase